MSQGVTAVSTRRFFRAALLVPSIAIAAGCMSLSDAQLEARDYRRADFGNQFKDFRQRCRARGGKIVIEANQSLGRGDLPHRGDRYFCM